jgi:trans-aconitate methyltransferase
MPVQEEALNLRTYRVPAVASHYAALNYLTPCEQLLFRTYIKPGMAVLDLGVGGGRTTSYLSRIASRYVGVDYSEAMIHACRRKFLDLDFMLADASDLSVCMVLSLIAGCQSMSLPSWRNSISSWLS